MRAQEMERLMTVAGRLRPAQRETLLATLMSGWARCEALDLVQGRLGQTPSCPKCVQGSEAPPVVQRVVHEVQRPALVDEFTATSGTGSRCGTRFLVRRGRFSPI